jgi:hypothetical protein
MRTKWFADLTSCSPKKGRFFRPWLESLEERNAPSGHGDPGGDPPGPPHPPGPSHPPPPAPISVGASAGNNNHGSFNNSTITDSFNNTINIAINLPSTQSAAVTGLLGISNLLSSVLNNPQLGSLLDDEIALAVDTYLTSPAISASLPASVVSSLKADEATLSAAIAANPLESNPFGAALGMLAFDMTLNALTTAQPTI